MSTSAVYKYGQAGIQNSGFGTAATPTFTLPLTGTYQDSPTIQRADFDSGRWVNQFIEQRVADYATFTLSGAAFFEMLPVIHNAAWNDTAPVGSDPYAYDYTLDIDGDPVTPTPYTFRFGGNEDIGGTGPAIQIQDGYVESYSLTGNFNSREISFDSSWFGLKVDDNSGAGYTFAATAIPSTLGLMRFPYGTLSYQDATTTGGDFATMTDFACTLLDWKLSCNNINKPKWCADAGALTFQGLQVATPEIMFEATLRTDSTSYAAVAAKANAASPTYQELQFTLTGADSRQAIFNFTGRWAHVQNVHEVANDELVMKATFMAQGYPSQTTTPHAFGYEIDTQWNHT